MILAHLKPEHWVHHFLEVLEQILDALNLPEKDVELEPHRDLDGDGGLGLHPEAGLVPRCVWPEPVLELPEISSVRLRSLLMIYLR